MSIGINPIISNLFNKIEDLDEGNWFLWSKQMKMLFPGCNAPQIVTGVLPTDQADLAEFNVMNIQLMAYIYAKVSATYQYLIEEEMTASGAWAKLKAYFEKPTTSRRMAARKAFYSVHYDPEKHIAIYIQAVSAACAKLQAFGGIVTDTELIDVLLMNINESLHSVRAIILDQKEELDLLTVKNMLINANSHVDNVKTRYNATLLTHEHHNITHHHSLQSPHSTSGNNTSSPPPPVDNQGYCWCDTSNESACHLCGRKRHKAAHCMYDMPQPVKDWLMVRSRSFHSHSRSHSPHHHGSHTAHYDNNPYEDEHAF